jgi:multiple sugar transport system permease protein
MHDLAQAPTRRGWTARPGRRKRRFSATRLTRKSAPYLLVAPAVLALCIIVAYPIVYNFYISVFKWNILDSDTPEHFVGLANYATILNDAGFLNSLRITIVFTVLALALEFLLGLGLALVVHERIFAQRLIRTVLVAPLLATPLVIGLVFRLIWHSDFGIANFILNELGLGPVAWLSHPHSAFIALLLTELWHNTGFVFLILLGALQMLPVEPYEAAMVDGASAWQRFRYITLPLLRPAILVAVLFRLVFVIRMFDEAWVLTQGGPESGTETISILIYKAAFQQFRIGYSAALSVILLVLTAGLAMLLVRILGRDHVA